MHNGKEKIPLTEETQTCQHLYGSTEGWSWELRDGKTFIQLSLKLKMRKIVTLFYHPNNNVTTQSRNLYIAV